MGFDFDFGGEPMSERKLVRLRDRYPTTSRITRWRFRNEPGFPNAVIVRNTEYFYDDELEAYEESRRCAKQEHSAAASSTAA